MRMVAASYWRGQLPANGFRLFAVYERRTQIALLVAVLDFYHKNAMYIYTCRRLRVVVDLAHALFFLGGSSLGLLGGAAEELAHRFLTHTLLAYWRKLLRRRVLGSLFPLSIRLSHERLS